MVVCSKVRLQEEEKIIKYKKSKTLTRSKLIKEVSRELLYHISHTVISTDEVLDAAMKRDKENENEKVVLMLLQVFILQILSSIVQL